MAMRGLVLVATMAVMVALLQGAPAEEGGAGSSSSFGSESAKGSSPAGTVEETVATLKSNKTENTPEKNMKSKPKDSEASAEKTGSQSEAVSVKEVEEKKTTSVAKDPDVKEDKLDKDEAVKSEEKEETEPNSTDVKKPAAESLVDNPPEEKGEEIKEDKEVEKEPEPDAPEETVEEIDEGENLEEEVEAKVTPQIEERPGSYSEHTSSGEEEVHSHFMSYFMVLGVTTIVAYLVFHNKKKILGLIVEGRGGRQAGRRRLGGREYRKLDSNVEDMMETGRETSMRQVIY